MLVFLLSLTLLFCFSYGCAPPAPAAKAVVAGPRFQCIRRATANVGNNHSISDIYANVSGIYVALTTNSSRTIHSRIVINHRAYGDIGAIRAYDVRYPVASSTAPVIDLHSCSTVDFFCPPFTLSANSRDSITLRILSDCCNTLLDIRA